MPSVAEALGALVSRKCLPERHRDRSKRFYQSFAWRRLRYQVLAKNALRNSGTAQCELCGTKAAAGAPLNVDHIVPLSKDWERRLDPTNLQVMCGPCNHGKLNRDDHDWRPEGGK